MQVWLLRHARASWSMGQRDAERRLTPQGEEDARRMGAWMAQEGLVPDRAVTSPAVRCRDTAHLVLPDGDWGAWSEDARVYEATLLDLLAVLADAEGAERLLLVGHNPGMEHLVHGLDPRTGPPPDGEWMPTCTLARLQLDAPRLGGGRLLDRRCVRDLPA